MSTNQHKHSLSEVLCAFWFKPESNNWDSTYFGKYFDKINSLGYNEKNEQKGFQVQFQLKNKDGVIKKGVVPTPELNELESRMVFNNTKEGFAIVMASNYISFHKLEPYKTWELLMSEQVMPAMKLYNDLGLGNDVLQVQSLYVNKYTFPIDGKLSDHFKFLPTIEDFGNGKENSLLFQSQYQLDPNLMQQVTFNTILKESRGEKEIVMQCGCVASQVGNTKWTVLAEQAHVQNNKVFKSITK